MNCLQLFLLALLIQQVEQASGFLADEVDTTHVVCVVDVVPGDSLCLVFLLEEARQNILENQLTGEIKSSSNSPIEHFT